MMAVKVSFKQHLLLEKKMSRPELAALENYASKLFKALGIKIAFAHHFFDRLTDSRNGQDITLAELIRMFDLQYKQNAQAIRELPVGAEAILQDMKTDINIPVVFKWNQRTGMIDLLAKSILRKKNFYGNDKRLVVEAEKHFKKKDQK